MDAPPRTSVDARPPSAALRQYVKRMLVVDHQDETVDAHVPDTGLVLAIRLDGECRFENGSLAPCSGVAGLFQRVRRHAHSPHNRVALVALNPGGGAAVLRQPLDVIGNQTVRLDDLIENSSVVRLEAQLADTRGNDQIFDALERFLFGRIQDHEPDPLIDAAIDWLERAPSDARITSLVRHVGLSQSALERRFGRVVGASPKRFAVLVRLSRVLRLGASGRSLTEVAHAAGYADQSHFVHDFRRLTGTAPSVYFGRRAVH